MRKASAGKVALFGEAQKGNFQHLFEIRSLIHLAETLGHPPEGSIGLHLGIQTLLYQKELLFIRVKEEGFSMKDYVFGLKLLREQVDLKAITAIAMPGVGDHHILTEAWQFCSASGAFLMTSEKDFYDYVTHIVIS